ncbi:hypothetical protein [Aliivibrio finisterrensis]|uniref:DUF115 domain-containing protein n=1 Tax=Aliivibrio finisterrensis TaxID=511998 RepID=A0A6N6RPT7_9GAMM|nr:hypothetical protein [Aliivibrio finisterrensis]KAB2823520.1 hypothetical protein F8B77_15205 [Aliivibrio finisterrensis]
MNDFLMLRLRRKAIKRYIKLTTPRSEWFKADYWPDLKKQDDNWFFKNIKLNIRKLSSINTNNKIVNIIGSGPSVNDLDLKKLKSGKNVFLNGAVSLAYENKLPIYAHVIMDSNFIYNRFDLLKKNNYRIKYILGLGAICAIAERDINILLDNDIYLFYVDPLTNSRQFSNSINDHVIDGGTVMSIAIQVFLNSNPSIVYLLGLDISNAHLPRFYEHYHNMQKSGLQKDFEYKILPFMKSASAQYHQNNVELYNCSPVSKLPFDIIPYSDHYEK